MKTRAIVVIALVFCLQVCSAALTAQEYFDLATVQYIAGDFDGALANLQAALKVDPGFKPALQLIEGIKREKNIAPILKRDKEKEAEKKPKPLPLSDSKEYVEIGKNFFNRGMLFEAVDCFTKSISPQSSNQESIAYLKEIPRIVAEREKEYLYNYRIFVIAYSAGYLFLAILLCYLAIVSERVLAEKFGERRRAHVCPNCHAPLSPDADICPSCGVRVGSKIWSSVSEEQRIWYKKVGWKRNPFSLDIQPNFFTGYKKEVKEILEKIKSSSGHILITGPLGIGKTTMLCWMANYLLSESLHLVYVPRPPQQFSQLIKFVLERLGMSLKLNSDYDAYNIDRVRKKMGKRLVLLLDEAHEFTSEIERPLRTLGDLDEITLVMAGLPEAVEKIKKDMLPLYERLVLEIVLNPFNQEDLQELIKTRTEGVGGKGIHPFTAAALDRVFKISKGNPRTALKLCDAAVTKAINQGEDNIDVKFIKSNDKEEPKDAS